MSTFFSQTNPDELLVPPVNFSLVAKGIYRGSYPNARNFSFLKHLGLKTILFLCPEDYSQSNSDFLKANNIKLITVPMEGNKEPFKIIPTKLMNDALTHLADKRNHPIYIHCNKGKHRTGSVVGCFRKLQLWTLTSIFEEYRRFAGTKARQLDEQYIELYVPPIERLNHEIFPECLSHLN